MSEEEGKNEGGRPRIIETPEEFRDLVDSYVDGQIEAKKPITFSGMALHLGFSSLQSFYDYETYDGFKHEVLRARLIITRVYEERLQGPQPTGAIFALKNQGWKDAIAQELSGPGGGAIEVQWTEEVIDPDDGDDWDPITDDEKGEEGEEAEG